MRDRARQECRSKADKIVGNVGLSEADEIEAKTFDEDLPYLRIMIACTTAILFASFMAFVYLYGTFGGDWVDGLDEQVGEIMQRRASLLADAGMVDEAMEAYRISLAGHFDRSENRQRAAISYARLLYAQGMHDETVEILRETLERYGGSSGSYSLLAQSLHTSGDYDEALAVCGEWFAWADKENIQEQKALSRYQMGITLNGAQRKEEAIATLIQVYPLDPTIGVALSVARQLIGIGEVEEAGTLLDIVLAEGQPPERRAAVKLKASIVPPE